MTTRCAVLGDPIDHSLSPVLHRTAYAALGLDWNYDAVQVPAGALGDWMAGLDPSWRGLSLTMPLKREVLALADARPDALVSDRARLAGGANTVVLEPDGAWRLDNTDLPGAAAAVRERYDGPVTAVTVLGAGATAASVALALCDLGAREVRLLARDAGRAETTRAAVAAHPTAPSVVVADLASAPITGEVLVSTIPATAQDESMVERAAGLPVVFEVLYDPWPTALAATVSGVLVGGLDLLVHQAALQVELFTGQPAPVDEMRVAGGRALAARMDLES